MRRVLFHLPLTEEGVPLAAWGTFLLAGFVLGLVIAMRWARVRGIRPVHVFDTVVTAAIAGLVGARLTYVIEYWQSDFAGRPWSHVFDMKAGGMVFYGGYALAAVVSIGMLWLRRLDWPEVADILAPCVALGGMMGRMGCFLNGCCFGQTCPPDHPLAAIFPSGCPCFDYQATSGIISAGAAHTVPVYATQLLEAAGYFFIFLLLSLLLWRRPPRLKGAVFLAFLLLYPILRFATECYRVSARGPFGLSSAQYVSIGIFVVAAAFAVAWWFHSAQLVPHVQEGGLQARAETGPEQTSGPVATI